MKLSLHGDTAILKAFFHTFCQWINCTPGKNNLCEVIDWSSFDMDIALLNIFRNSKLFPFLKFENGNEDSKLDLFIST